MTSPFGRHRSADSYYQYGGQPQKFVYNWKGSAFPQVREGDVRALGAIPDEAYIEDFQDAKFMTDLGEAESDVLGTEMEEEYGPGWPVAMSMQSGRRSILHTGAEQAKLSMGPPVSLGFFGSLSRNEQRLMMLAGAGAAAFFAWKYFGKKKGARK